jgi:hypothetical protein
VAKMFSSPQPFATLPREGVASTPRLSGVRTFLLVGLAVVWFCEGVFTGVQPLAEWWTRFWRMFPPETIGSISGLSST